jgi:PAS domain S-box-containing protein
MHAPTAALLEEYDPCMSDRNPLYNSRLLQMAIQFLRHHYPALKIESVLKEAGIAPYQIEDPAHWFTQEEVDRLNAVLVSKTGDADVSRHVGQFAASSDGLGAAKQYMLGLMSPAIVYQLMERHYKLLSRGASITTRRLGPVQVEIISTPKPGVAEKPYQCANRSGIFEALARWFTGASAHIEHPECFHRGAPHCRYIITWEKSPPHHWRRIRNVTALASLIISSTCLTFMPFYSWAVLSLLLIILIGLCAIQSERLGSIILTQTIEAQRKAAEQTLRESDVRYNNSLLIQEIGQATSTILDIEALVREVLGIIKKRMDFDRGMIMLADKGNYFLRYVTGYGHSPDQEATLQQTHFNLNNPNSKGVFVIAMRERRPFLIDNLQEIEASLSPKSLAFARQLGSHSLICVPIVYEKKSLGILAVDNSQSNRALQQSDMNLLLGVASQLATSIVNALSFERIQESEKKYRELVETASSAILRVNGEGRITYVNDFAQHLFGYGESELLGAEAAGFILPVNGSEAESLPEFISAMSRDPLHPVVGESETTLRSGKTVWIAWAYRPIYDDHGLFQEMLCIGNDITELKNAEQARKELQLQLQRAQKMEAIGTLAGGVAHDLNNILSGIVSYPDLLLLDIPEDSPLLQPILTIKKSGERAAAIVQDLLTLARRGVETTAVVDVNQIVTDYLASPEFSKLKLDHPKVTTEVHLDSHLLNIVGSPAHLSKTIMNLVVNAAEAMADGGTIVIRTENRYLDQLTIGYNEVVRGDFVILVVSDTGIGISAEDMERIFEPFYTKKAMGRSGTGLGMAVVWGTVKDHRGHIDIKSRVGEGTDVTLFFPATRQALHRLDRLPVEAFKGKGEAVLVVDDIKEQREIAGEILGKLGYSVATAASGEDALEHLRRKPADLVVLDMIMEPGIDGLETFRRIRGLRPEQKTVIASGYSESVLVREAQRMGAGAYVKKPYLLETFGRAVRAELDKR